MNKFDIIGCPDEAWDYEFIVVAPDDGNYYYYSHHTNGYLAEQDALKINGVVVHNVRIQGRRKHES